MKAMKILEDTVLEPVNASLNMRVNQYPRKTAGSKSAVDQMRAEAATPSHGVSPIFARSAPANTKNIEAGCDRTRLVFATKTELGSACEANDPKLPDQTVHKPTYTREVLEAAACLSVGIDEKTLVASYGERTSRNGAADSPHRTA